MEFHRTGPHQGYWRLKTTIEHPTRAKMLRIVEPENVVLSEATAVGNQQLDDAGYGIVADWVSVIELASDDSPYIDGRTFGLNAYDTVTVT